MNSIFKRTSVRMFEPRMVEDEKIKDMLRAAMAAPSAMNQQPWEFFIVKKGDILEKLSTASKYAVCLKNAPVAILLCYRNNIPAPEYADIDMAVCAENLLLEATELKLGAVFLGISPHKDRMDAVAEIINCPDNLTPFCIIPFGYPAKEIMPKNHYDEKRIHEI